MIRAHKYGNRKTIVDGETFDSKAEAMRWRELRTLERIGNIHSLIRSRPYDLNVNGAKVCTYVSDFVYCITAENREVIEDVKGVQTQVFRLKARFMAATGNPITIRSKGISTLLDFKPKKRKKK